MRKFYYLCESLILVNQFLKLIFVVKCVQKPNILVLTLC